MHLTTLVSSQAFRDNLNCYNFVCLYSFITKVCVRNETEKQLIRTPRHWYYTPADLVYVMRYVIGNGYILYDIYMYHSSS